MWPTESERLFGSSLSRIASDIFSLGISSLPSTGDFFAVVEMGKGAALAD
jgi:hypothetical protein